jgi:hypothetical protein
MIMYFEGIVNKTKKLKVLVLLVLTIPGFALSDQQTGFDHDAAQYKVWAEQAHYHNDSSDFYGDKSASEDKHYHGKKWSEYVKEARSHFRMRLRELFQYLRRIRAALKDPDTDWDNFDWSWGDGDDPADDDSTGDDSTGDDSTGDDSTGDSLPIQLVSVSNQPLGLLGENIVVDLAYSASDDNNQLSGLGLRVHFDSTVLTLNSIDEVLLQDVIVNGEGPVSDAEDFDNDPQTDSYITFGWASLFNNWPNAAFPSTLAKVTFGVSSTVDLDALTSTAINFSGITTAAGYQFDSQSFTLELSETESTWDFDGNGNADALTDGLIMMRYSFGLRGDSMTDNAMSEDSQMSVAQVEERLSSSMKIADIDDDGKVDALTDGLLLLRHLFAMDDESFTHGAVAHSASRKTKYAIKHHLNKYMPKKKRDKE